MTNINALHIGKTIVVWDKLNDEEIKSLVYSLVDIIKIYKEENIDNKPIPIKLIEKDKLLSIIKKHDEIVLSLTKNNGKYIFNPILNGDELYKSIGILKNAEYTLKSEIKICKQFPNTKWIELPFYQAFEIYAMSPNINPEDFIENLKKGLYQIFKNSFY